MSSPQRDARGFYVLLFAAVIAFMAMVLPFAGALILAAVVVVLAWPMHARLLHWTRRPWLAAILSFAALVLGLGGAVALLAGLVVPELSKLTRDLTGALQPGTMDGLIGRIIPGRLNASAERLFGTDLGAELSEGLQSSAVSAAGSIAAAVPGLLQVTGHAAVQGLVFLLALASFLASGEQMLAWAMRLAPLDPVYSRRLITIFASFSRNVVLASAVGAVTQGSVAGVGYAIAGVDRALLFAVLTMGVAVVPFIGSALVWVPLTVLLVVQGHTGPALFLIIWSLTLTASVDNVVKPLVVRGKSDLHPLLVFLGVFGGLYSMGFIGLLIGPMLAAMVVALFTIYEERRAEASIHTGEAPEASPPDAAAG